jgi:hypothetical protein
MRAFHEWAGTAGIASSPRKSRKSLKMSEIWAFASMLIRICVAIRIVRYTRGTEFVRRPDLPMPPAALRSAKAGTFLTMAQAATSAVEALLSDAAARCASG